MRSDVLTPRKVDCKVDGVDPFALYRVMIGSQQYNCIRFDGMFCVQL